MAPHQFRVEAVLPAPAQSYFLERDSAAFRSLLSKVLKIGQLNFDGLWHEGQSTYVRMITKPEFGSWVPKGVAGHLQSSNLEFHDIIEYNPAAIASPPYKIFVRTESPFLKDKLDIQLTLTIEELEDGASCRQILEGHIHVRMFGVGRIVEGIVKDSLQKTYTKLPEIVRRWQMFREEALRTGDGRQLLLGRPPVGCEVQWIRQEVLQILQEPLPEDDAGSPTTSLCLVAGASKSSEDMAAVHAPAQQLLGAPTAVEGAAQQEPPTVAAGEMQHTAFQQQAVAVQEQPAQQQDAAGQQLRRHMEDALLPHGRQQAEEEAPDVAGLLVGQARRQPSMALSARSVTEYYDARDACLEDDASSGPPQQQAAASPAALPPGKTAVAAPADGATTAAAASVSPASFMLGSAPGLAAVLLGRGAHHRRTLSGGSAGSTDTPSEEVGQPRQPASRRFWRRFNRDYSEWGDYWDEVGVEQQEMEGQPGSGGVVLGALHAFEEVMKNSYYSASILVALFLLRNGWLRVEPDANACDLHDEHTRQHAGHRHNRSASGSGAAGVGGSATNGCSSDGEIVDGAPPLPYRQQSLARVAAEVQRRMVSGSRAVAAAPKRAVVAAGSSLAAAGSSMRQASVTGAKAMFARPKSAAGGGTGEGSSRGDRSGRGGDKVLAPAGSAVPGAAATVAVAGSSLGAGGRHRKTMSLDTGTAAAACQAAAAALQQQGGQGGTAAASGRVAGNFSKKILQRRPSDMAAVAAMNSMQRVEGRMRPPSRLSCFSICHRPPAVKD